MFHLRSVVSALAVALFAAIAVSAQSEPKFDFYDRGPYRTEVPRPQSILRYDVGDHHTTYAQMERVIEAIAKAAPDRVRIFDIGLTNEYRMKHIVAISSPKNMARLEEIKAANARLTDPRTLNPTEAQRIISETPAVAWMAYTIHGNESASFETMMQVVYQYAASNDPKTLEVLDNTVVLVITGENPDGHERFATWYNSVGIGNPDRLALEHREPWSIWGRYNRYRFDLNRDNISMSQVETRNLVKAFLEWNPQLVVDHHGQPSQFFFPPTALPINPNFPQPVTDQWMQTFGKANAEAFDKNKWAYYNRDVYDLFYPGYVDSYTSLNGAIGMTYETDGGGNKGLAWTRDDGTIVTLRSAIAKHYVASLTTLETLSKNKAKRQQDFYDFRRKAMEENTPLKRVVIIPDKDRVKAAELMELLMRSRIEVKVAKAPFSSSIARSYEEKNAPAEKRTFPAGSYVIEVNQPQKRLIKALLEQDTPQDAAFVREEMGKFRRNQMRGKNAFKENYRFYDITAWSLPLAFGLDAYGTEDTLPFDGAMVTPEFVANAKKGSATKAAVAYLIPYDTDAAGVMAIRLLKEGYKVNVASRILNAEGKDYDRGTLVVRIARNPDSVHDAVARLSEELGVNPIAINSGYSEEGDNPVGGQNNFALTEPKVAIVADEGVSQTSYGSIWWTLDKYGIKHTPMTVANLRNGGLKKYNVLIMPDGQAGRYVSAFGPGGIADLKEWVQEGGTLITVSGASVFATLKNVGLTSSTLVGSEEDDEKSKKSEGKSEGDKKPSGPAPSPTPDMRTDKQDWQPPVLPPIASPSAFADRVPEGIPGSIMRAKVDRTSYLNYGVKSDELPVLLASGYFFRFSKEGTNALIFEAEPKRALTISGFVWEGHTEKLLKGTAYVIDEPLGDGRVVLFAEEPFFRGIFRSVTRPFMNSILFSGAF